MSECVDKLVQAFPSLNKEQVAKYVTLLEELKMKNSFNMGKYNKEAKELFEAGKLQEVLNLKAKFTDSIKLSKNKTYMTMTKGFSDAGEALLSKIYGSNKVANGVYDNFEGKFLSIKGDLQSGLLTMLRQEGIDKVALSGAFDKEIANYLYAKVDGRDVSKYPDEIKRVGDLYQKYNIKMALDQQAVGIPITPKANFLFTQNHNLEAILPNPQAWIDDMLNNPDVDWDKSFQTIGVTEGGQFSVAKARTALEQMVDGFRSGMAFIDAGGGKTFGGGAVQLVFKTGEGFLNYNSKWGNGTTLLEGMMGTIAKHSEKTALVDTFGNNPIQKIKELRDYAEKNGASVSNINEINKAIAYLQGVGNRAVNPDGWGARAFHKVQQAKGLTNLVFLAKSGFTSLLDIPTTAFTLHEAYGENIWKATANTIGTFVNNAVKSKAEKQELLDYLKISLQDMKNEVLATYGGDYKVGKISKLNDVFMTINGTNLVTSLSRTTAAELHAKNLNYVFKQGESHRGFKNTVTKMGLTEAEIADIRQVAKLENDVLSPTSILEYSKLDAKAKTALATKVGGYLSQQMFSGSPAPTMKQKIQMGRHLPQDSMMRLAYEIGLQYKASLLKVYSNAEKYIRSTSSDGSFKVDNWNQFRSVANTGLAMFSTAAVIQSIEDLATGKEREYDSKWFKQMAQDSGMLGIYLDFTLSVYENRLAPPLMKQAFGVIDHTMNELKYAAGVKPDKRTSETRVLPPMKLKNRNMMDRQIKLLEKNMPNHVLWMAFRNYILEESNARRRR